MDINSLPERAKKVEKETKTFFKSIKKNRHRELDDTIHAIHEEVFDSINCLDCGNCCRTLGPRITDRDIERIAQALRIKPHEVVQRHLHIDEDKDYVFRSMLVLSWEATIIAVFMRTVRKPAGNIRIRTGKSSTRYMH